MTTGILPSNKRAGPGLVDLGIGINRTFTPGETETTAWVDVRRYSQVWITAESTTIGTGTLQWSMSETEPSATPTDAELLEIVSATIAEPELFDGAINVSIKPTPAGNWFRAIWEQGAVGGDLVANVRGILGPSRIPVTQVAFPIDDSDEVVPVKAVISRQNPENENVLQRQGGIHPLLSTDTPLTANAVFRSPWVEVLGFSTVAAVFKSDVASATDGAVVYFAREAFDAQAIEGITQANPAVVTITGHGYAEGDEVLIDGVVGMTEVNDRYFIVDTVTTDTFELFGEDSTGHGAYVSGGTAELVRIATQLQETYEVSGIGVFPSTPVQDGFVRLEYTNGPVAQQTMLLHTSIYETGLSPDMRSVGGEIKLGNTAAIVKAIAHAHPDDISNPLPVLMDLTTRGMKVHFVGTDIRLPVSALPNRKTGQLNATSLAASQITLESWVKTIAVKNMDANENIFVGFVSTVTANNGFLISPLLGDSYPVNSAGEFWVISGAPVASTATAERLPATINNNGAVDPNNALTENNIFAVLDNANDSVTALGYTAAGTFPDVSVVTLGVKCRRAVANTTQVAHVSTVTGTANDVPAVSTSSSVTAVSTNFYLAAITFRDSTQTVESVSGLGLSWAQVASKTSDGGFNRTEVWAGTGTPSLTGIVTASLSAAADNAVIAVSRFSGVNLADPIETTATQGTGTPSSNVLGNVNADTNDDRVYSAIGMRRRTATPGSGFTEHADLRTGTTANDAALHVQSKLVTGTGSQTVDATLTDGTADWALVMVTLNKGSGTPPTITMSHDLGPTTLVEQLTSTTNTDFTVDVSADRVWNATDIGNVQVTVEATEKTDINAEIDYIYLIVEEIDEGGLTRVCWMQLGDTGP